MRETLTRFMYACVAVLCTAQAGQICFEAEMGVHIRPNLEIVEREGASGGKALGVFEGGGGNHNWLSGPSCSIDIGTADYPFEVTTAGSM